MFWSFIGKVLLDILVGVLVKLALTAIFAALERYRQSSVRANFA